MPKLKNPKHELLAKNIIKSKFNLTKAYQSTYPDSDIESSAAHVHRLVGNGMPVSIRVNELAEASYTPELVVEDLIAYRSATRPVICNDELIDYPDYSTRLENTKTVLKMYGVLGGDGSTVNIDARSVNFTLDTKDIEKLSEVASMMKSLRDKMKPSTQPETPST